MRCLAMLFQGSRRRPNDGGGVALTFALALPPLVLAVVAGLQLSYVVNVRTQAQDVADSAALMGAQQLNSAPIGAADRASAWARDQLAASKGAASFEVSASPIGAHAIRVDISTYTPSFFGDLLPAGGFRGHAVAQAEQQSQTPLCVLIDGPGANDDVTVSGTSQLTGSCLVHTNKDVAVDTTAAITTTATEAGGSARGPINPAARAGAVAISDPFSALDLSFPSTCSSSGNTDYTSGTVPAGMHQTQITIKSGSAVTLAAGLHYFCSQLIVEKTASLTASNVTLVFDKQSQLSTASGASISLSGSRTGKLAGFVIAVARNDTDTFAMSTDGIVNVTGTIYSPLAKLRLSGSERAAQASDWTVIAARELELKGSANLQINTNYQSLTPVPVGVGNRTSSGGVRITH